MDGAVLLVGRCRGRAASHVRRFVEETSSTTEIGFLSTAVDENFVAPGSTIPAERLIEIKPDPQQTTSAVAKEALANRCRRWSLQLGLGFGPAIVRMHVVF